MSQHSAPTNSGRKHWIKQSEVSEISQRRCVQDLEAYPFKPNLTATSRAIGVVCQLETKMACNASQDLNVYIPVRQPDSAILGDVIFRGMPTLRCQVGKLALVHFVRPAVGSCSSAAAITAAEGLGNRPSSIFRRRRCARHCRCLIAMEREPKYLATRWALLVTDEISRHSSVSVGSGSVGLSRLLIRGTTVRPLAGLQHGYTKDRRS